MKNIPILLNIIFVLCYGVTSGQDYLMPTMQDGLWGYMDEYKEWKIPAKFDAATSFTQGLGCVQFYDKWGFIDKSGKWQILPKFERAKPFYEGLASVKLNGKWGFINKLGNWAIHPEFYAVSSFSEGLAVAYAGEKFYYIDSDGRKALDKVFSVAKPFTEGIASVIWKGEKGYIDFDGNWVIRHNYSKADAFAEGLALVRKDGIYGYINHRGDQVIPLQFVDANHFSEGFASVKVNGKWGYIDKRGKLTIRPVYEYAGKYKNGLAVVRKEGKYGMVNREGYWNIDPNYADLEELSRTISLEDEIKNYVTREIRLWEQKGEFEKTNEYYKRVTVENRLVELNIRTILGVNEIAQKYVRLLDAELGLYNADAEVFTIYIPGMMSSIIPVPIEDALWFKDNWEFAEIKYPEFSVYNDEFVLTMFKAFVHDNEYAYNAYEHGVYTSNFRGTPEFGKLDIVLPELPIPIATKEPSLIIVDAKSDVDDMIPVNNLNQENVFALVIGNENYSSYQIGNEINMNVDFAEQDARVFSQYLHKTFGVPSENISLLVNATAGQMNQALSKMSALAKAYEGEAEFIFYYAGHGIPDEESREPYLVPVDVAASDLTYAISLQDVYDKYTKHEAKRVTIILDACFSGGARSESLLASRGIRIRPKSPFVMGNLIVFSAARGEQTAFAYNEKSHGMFTYHMLKKIQETGGMLTYGELAQYLEFEVNKRSLLINNREQEPTFKVSPILEYTWRDSMFLNYTNTFLPELADEY